MNKLPVDSPGTVWICRMCLKLAEACSLGGFSCGVPDCGGPMQGKSFPKYSGPLAAVVCSYCYCCGAEAEASMTLDHGGKLGVCKNCLKNKLNVDIPNQEKK